MASTHGSLKHLGKGHDVCFITFFRAMGHNHTSNGRCFNVSTINVYDSLKNPGVYIDVMDFHGVMPDGIFC